MLPPLRGYVLTPDWLPVSGGAVTLRSLGSERVATIGPTGRFRITGLTPGVHDVSISAPGFMTHRLKVMVPASGIISLPPIPLWEGSHLRMRVFSPDIQPLTSPGIVRESHDVDGRPIPERSERAPRGVMWFLTS